MAKKKKSYSIKKTTKTIRKEAKKSLEDANPEWNQKILVSKDDVIGAMEFYKHYGVPIDPILQATVDKLKAGGILTLDDQRIIARTILSDIARRTHESFADDMFKDISVKAAEHLVNANKNT